jgi:adenine-specific DNA-methyltransferase
MIETTLTGKTPDIGEENIKKLMTMFPEVVTEGKVDFEKLKQLLGEYVDDSNERYNFTWNGKGRALRLSQTPSLGTLRPCKEESKDWDKTQNLYIEGENLEVLKLLQKSYYGKIKMIYIDPPYNTGKDFVYRDDFHDSLENYKRITGQVDGNGKAISTNTETSGRYHTDWLNMMYPRLRLARNLLADDGVIFISISDAEIENLKKICNEIYGEDNFIGNIIWNSTKSVTNTALISVSHTYNLVYSKNTGYFIENREEFRLPDDGEGFENPDNDPRGPWKADPFQVGGWRPNQQYEIINPNTGKVYKPNPGCSWKNDYNKFQELLADNRIVFGKTGEGGPQRKRFIWEAQERGKVAKTWWDDVETTTNGTQLLKKLFDNITIFDNPKPVGLIKKMLQLATSKNSIILDFFSGSATTAHAVMQLNAEDGGNRKFIMVQLPEPTDEKSEAYKAGYKNICEIGKERIRRAGEKIKEEYKDKENIENLDIGFKVFKLDTSNIRKWQPDYDNLEQSLMDYVDNFVEGRTELDVVYEIMLKYGLDLTYPIDEFTIAGKKVYSIGYGMLMICLDDEITTDVARGILAQVKELSPESSRVVFKDNGFKTDSNKTNIKEILKSGGIDEFITI